MPDMDRSGPRGEGPLTGGRRGLCNGTEGHGFGRGGRARGGGRGRARGRGRGWAWSYGNERAGLTGYPLPDEPQVGAGATISGILERLSQLAAAVADLHERFAAGGETAAEDGNER
jgi:hypothetical protein